MARAEMARERTRAAVERYRLLREVSALLRQKGFANRTAIMERPEDQRTGNDVLLFSGWLSTCRPDLLAPERLGSCISR